MTAGVNVASRLPLPSFPAGKNAGRKERGARPPQEAYLEYLKSISYISQVLLEEAAAAAEDDSDVAPDTPKMLKVAEQCLERAKSSVSKIGKAKVRLVREKSLGPAPGSRHRRVSSDEGGKLSPFLPPEMFQKLHINEVQSPRNRELGPLEEASLQNQKLKATYEARLARLNPTQAVQKTSLTLSLQRQMMENLVVAKARKEALQRKMEEHRLRLQEAANRRFSSNAVLTPEEQEQRAIYAAILAYEQDHDWLLLWKAQLKEHPSDVSLVPKLLSHLLSFSGHPICQLLKKLQCCIYTRLYPLASQSAADPLGPPRKGSCSWSLSASSSSSSSLDAETFLPSAPEGRRLRSSQSLHSMRSVQELNKLNLRHSISGTPFIEDHSRLLGPQEKPAAPALADRESSLEDLQHFLSAQPAGPLPDPLAWKKPPQQEPLAAVVKDIHNSLDRLLSLTLLAFEGLNVAAAKDQCLAQLEEAFFGPLWAPLSAVYRNVYRAQEAALCRIMELHRKTSPTEMGICPRLLPQGRFPGGDGPPPYYAAVQELLMVPLGSCPQRKLECIVRTSRIICECAEEYCGGRLQPASAAIGADDLLPILSFVVLKSNLPQLVSECAALEEFIHEGDLIGEEGYCLTSLQSALAYLQSLQEPPGQP